MTERKAPSEAEVLAYMESLSNWGRWGPDDELGTLNLITPQKKAAAAALVTEGIGVSCARPIIPQIASDTGVDRVPPMHYMINSGEAAPAVGPGGVSDFIGLYFHGWTITHLDSICHQFWDGKMFNGKSARDVGTQSKATVGGIQLTKDGIVTRGVLLDVTKIWGKPWLEAGEAVFPEHLEAAEQAQGVRVEEGDALIVRMGWFKKREEVGPPPDSGRPGLHAACLPWLRERGVSLIVADASQDVQPSGYSLRIPIHTIGMVGMGLWLIDAANLEEITPVCERLNRWEFMFTVAPLRWDKATGCPVNPLAIF